ncbi:hypothetical protein [Vibrio cyclitrophicus]|uniref:hypothetical protein n=1 Tax=Vibrio cyclitrophicus TaxID=47951 RepID=UPI00029AD90F|nr:hypothetical protein [Vibrio cyclitrophicus]OEE21955.1 hypothetical protein OAM_22325 [Vibrio cyclitrophicus ZF14]
MWLDLNRNSTKDPDEPSATSGTGGIAELDVTNSQDYPVIVRAIADQTEDEDEDEDQGLVTSDYVMSASPGEDKVTPLSTLVNVLLEQSLTGSETSAELEQKKQQALTDVAQQLGIDSDDVLGDFTAGNQTAAAYAAENLVLYQVLPEDSSGMANILEQDSSNSSFVKAVQVVNAEINKKIDQVESSGGSMDFATVGVTDSDSDGVPDDLDKFPNGSAEYADFDDDGINDDIDDLDYQYLSDTDNDGYQNDVDAFPQDPSEHVDSDGDGTGDVADLDDDNDGVNYLDDQYPNDTDNDGYENEVDAFPEDPAEHADSDNDGIGDNADTTPNGEPDTGVWGTSNWDSCATFQ